MSDSELRVLAYPVGRLGSVSQLLPCVTSFDTKNSVVWCWAGSEILDVPTVS